MDLRIGNYTLLEAINSQGRRVHRAEGPLGSPAVLALFELDDVATDGLRRDWERCAALEHPHVARALELFEHDGTLVAAFEGVRGVSLLEVLAYLDERHEHLSDGAALKIGLATASAIHAAHTAKDEAGKVSPLVHGQLGPHQVFLSFDGSVRLLGLGLGTAFRTAAARHELPEAARPYAAPETRQGGTLTVRANVYSLAAILWRLLSRRPLPERVPPSLRLLRPDLSSGIAALVDRGLEASMIKRTVSSFQLAQTIERSGLADPKDLEWNLAILAETKEYANATIGPMSFPPAALSDVPPDSAQPVSVLPPDGDWSDFPTGRSGPSEPEELGSDDVGLDDLDWGLEQDRARGGEPAPAVPKSTPTSSPDEPPAARAAHETLPEGTSAEPEVPAAPPQKKRWKAPRRGRRPPAKTQRLAALSPERAREIRQAAEADVAPRQPLAARALDVLDEPREPDGPLAEVSEERTPPSSKRPKGRRVETPEPPLPVPAPRDTSRSYVEVPPMPAETPAMAATRARIEGARKEALQAILEDDDDDDPVDSEDPTRQRWVFAPSTEGLATRRRPDTASPAAAPTTVEAPRAFAVPSTRSPAPTPTAAPSPVLSSAPATSPGEAHLVITPRLWLLSLGVVGVLCAGVFAMGFMLGSRRAAPAPVMAAPSRPPAAPPASTATVDALRAASPAPTAPASTASASAPVEPPAEEDPAAPDPAAALLEWQAHVFVETDQAGAHVYIAGRPAGLPNTLLTMSCGVKSVRLGNFPLTEWFSPSAAFKLPCQKRTDLQLGPGQARLKR